MIDTFHMNNESCTEQDERLSSFCLFCLLDWCGVCRFFRFGAFAWPVYTLETHTGCGFGVALDVMTETSHSVSLRKFHFLKDFHFSFHSFIIVGQLRIRLRCMLCVRTGGVDGQYLINILWLAGACWPTFAFSPASLKGANYCKKHD